MNAMDRQVRSMTARLTVCKIQGLFYALRLPFPALSFECQVIDRRESDDKMRYEAASLLFKSFRDYIEVKVLQFKMSIEAVNR